jgi:peroxidase
MASMITLILIFILFFSLVLIGNSLSYNYYEKTCPDVEFIVAKTVKAATASDKTVPAALLRMHFHDCFIRVMLQKKWIRIP